MSSGQNDAPRGYASPPCYLHEFEVTAPQAANESRPATAGACASDDPSAGTDRPIDPRQRDEVMRWRKAERARLIAARLAVPSRERRNHSERIARFLEEAIGDLAGITLSTYAPIRGEPGLTSLVQRVVASGGRHALPVVVEHGKPLVFRLWAPGEPLERGVWNIPQPPPQAEAVLPDVVIAPIVGYDAECYRLGYGGGFFDRTLAAMPKHPRVFGVGYAHAALATIHPQPHDIPMRAIVTESGIIASR
jgi:5,10-methenyltetrahydrofolate synthetase